MPIPDEHIISRHGVHWITISLQLILVTVSVLVLIVTLLDIGGVGQVQVGTAHLSAEVLRKLSLDERDLMWMSIAFFILAAVSLYRANIVRKSMILELTSRRIICQSGIVNTMTRAIPLNRISCLNVNQSAFGMMFGYGDIDIEMIDGHILQFNQIEAPFIFVETYNDAAAALPGGF